MVVHTTILKFTRKCAQLVQLVEHETLKVYMERQNTQTRQHDIEEQVGILTLPDLASNQTVGPGD